MKVLLFITDIFPFGKGEPFIENEVPFLHNAFDRVLIIPVNPRRDRSFCREHSGCEIYCYENSLFLKDIPSIILYSIHLVFSIKFYDELFQTIRITHNPLYFLKTAFHWVYTGVLANKNSKKISSLISSGDQIYIYSYWLSYHALIAVEFLKGDKRVKRRISRAHGFDLYYRFKSYPPLHHYLLDTLDYVLPCSIHGTHYLQELHRQFAQKCICSYLGTMDHGTQIFFKSDCMRIVSVSNVNRIKRLDRIIDALSITNAPVVWTHYGNGDLMEEIQQYAKAKLNSSNITVIWKGRVSNKDLMNELQLTCFDLMVNVSDSEGLPVSLMETMSLGLPCFATDVGGTSELVKDHENGYLVSPEIATNKLASLLSHFTSIQDELIIMRTNARSKWEKMFSAEKNYPSFIKQYLMEDADELSDTNKKSFNE